MFKNALSRHFNYELNQASPVQDDFVQVEKRDEDGNVFTVYEKFDYPRHQASLGTAKDWQLAALLRAGVNPRFNIHTGMNTRLEAAGQVGQFAEQVDKILSETNSEK